LPEINIIHKSKVRLCNNQKSLQ